MTCWRGIGAEENDGYAVTINEKISSSHQRRSREEDRAICCQLFIST
jgi:hypothetical protein